MVQNLMKTIQNRGWQQTGVLDCKSFVVCIHADGFVQVVSSPFLFCIKKQGHCSCKINIGSEFTNFSAVSAKMKFHSPLTETTKTHISKPDKSDENYLHGWIHKRTAERRSAALQSVNSQMVLNIVFTSTANGTRNFSNVLVLCFN